MDLGADEKLIAAIKNIFGEEAYLPDESLDRKHIADIAFHNPLKLKELNAIVHPAVLEDGNRWHAQQKDAPYTIKEAALIFESDSYKNLDKIITVFAPQNVRLERVILRGGNLSKEDIEARMAKQLPEEEKMKRANFIIYNDGEQALIPQVMKIHQLLCSEQGVK